MIDVWQNPKHTSVKTYLIFSEPISGQCFHCKPPEITRKPKFFSCFQGVWNENICQKWVNAQFRHIYNQQCTKKWSFPLRISSINVTKFAVSCGFGHIYWRNPLWKTSLFVQCNYLKLLDLWIIFHCEKQENHGKTKTTPPSDKGFVNLMINSFMMEFPII